MTREGAVEPVSRDQILWRERKQEKIIFHVQLTTSRIRNHTWLIHTLAICDNHTYITPTLHNVQPRVCNVWSSVVSSTEKKNISLSAFTPENLVSRDRFGSPVPRQRAHLHTQAESGAYLRDSSRVPRGRPFIYFKTPYAIGSVPGLSGHAIAYRWHSLPRVRRHRASKPQGSYEQVLP